MYGRERDGLAPASFGFIRIALGNFPVTLNISAWYAGIGLAPLVAMLALAVLSRNPKPDNRVSLKLSSVARPGIAVLRLTSLPMASIHCRYR